MKNTLIALFAITIVSCVNAPKDYVTLSGKITDKNSDSVMVRTRTYSKTIKVDENGIFSDTLKVETGTYNFYDGSESTSIFLKNGYDLNITLDTKLFDESISYAGNGAESNNFLASYSLLREELLDQDFLELDKEAFDDFPSSTTNGTVDRNRLVVESLAGRVFQLFESRSNMSTSFRLPPMRKTWRSNCTDEW